MSLDVLMKLWQRFKQDPSPTKHEKKLFIRELDKLGYIIDDCGDIIRKDANNENEARNKTED